MDSNLLFSVIIPTYHRNDLLDQCLQRLSQDHQTFPASQYEVIVTDDGSETTAQDMVLESYPWVKWVAGPKRGPAANRNNGAKFAQGRWLAFIDDDCLADPQWLESYANAIATQSSHKVFTGRVYVDRPRRSLAETSPIFEVGGRLPSGNFVIQKQLFKSIGGFDEQFDLAMEDVDIMLRLSKSGYELPFVKEASVCHPWRTRYFAKDGWKLNTKYGDSIFTLLASHPDQYIHFEPLLYARRTISRFIKETLPGIIRYKGAGIEVALIEHLIELQTAVYLASKNYPKDN